MQAAPTYLFFTGNFFFRVVIAWKGAVTLFFNSVSHTTVLAVSKYVRIICNIAGVVRLF